MAMLDQDLELMLRVRRGDAELDGWNSKK